MSTFIYFSYGSNMLTERLQARCPSAQAIGIAVVPNYELNFSKISKDGSGKATLKQTLNPNIGSFGVLFAIDTKDRDALDEAEGLGVGYDRNDQFQITHLEDRVEADVTTYLALSSAVNRTLQPYDWYKKLVVCGAVQHHLPDLYVDQLSGFSSIRDPEPHRKSGKQALEVLARAGFAEANAEKREW